MQILLQKPSLHRYNLTTKLDFSIVLLIEVEVRTQFKY